MTKPHEETWEPHPLDSRIVCKKGEGEVIADIRVPLHENGREVSALIAAAPDMARALLLNGCRSPADPKNSAWHTHDCWENNRASCSTACKATVAALTKAGVPLP